MVLIRKPFFSWLKSRVMTKTDGLIKTADVLESGFLSEKSVKIPSRMVKTVRFYKISFTGLKKTATQN
jgi:hypothetical protein